MLRAGVQSRGVWEVDLAQPETRRTYVRVHAHDDRRALPTPLANPRPRPAGTPLPVFASPDITVRPAWPVAAPPRFHSTIQSGALPVYDLWTFQTAFRWLYPSCVADGRWTDAMRDLVRFHRSVLGLSPGAFVDQTLWRHVVGGTVGGVDRGTRLRPDPIFSESATVTADPVDALARVPRAVADPVGVRSSGHRDRPDGVGAPGAQRRRRVDGVPRAVDRRRAVAPPRLTTRPAAECVRRGAVAVGADPCRCCSRSARPISSCSSPGCR